MSYNKIPSSYEVGGQTMDVRIVDVCVDHALGMCSVAGGYIEIANNYERDKVQSEESKTNTFYHELTHSILRTMGEFELDQNERFVCSFSSFLTEAMKDARFK